jgi:hypothetical protein
MDLLVCASQNWLAERDEQAAGAVAGRQDSRIVKCYIFLDCLPNL